MKKSTLLAELEEEDVSREESVEFPKIDFDIEKKIASILGERVPSVSQIKIAGSSIAEKLAVAYLVENLPAAEVKGYFGKKIEKGMEKMLLADIAIGLFGKIEYDPSKPLVDYALDVAMDIYKDVFIAMKKAMMAGKVKTPSKKEEKAAAADAEAEIFRHFKGNQAANLVAAEKIKGYVAGMEQRLSIANAPHEIKYLAGIKLYHDLMQLKESKDDVMAHVNDPKNKLEDVFIYTILRFHQDFYKAMENIGGK